MAQAKRVVMLGLDAMVLQMVDMFLEEGILPHFAQLLQLGSLTRILPVIPAQTPSNWNTLATGATPRTFSLQGDVTDEV